MNVPFRTRAVLHLAAAIGFFAPAASANEGGRFPAYRRPVMTWVPPYAVSECQERLSESYGGAGMAAALTHLGLQFWSPTQEGGLARIGRTNVTTDAAIAALRDWGHTNGVRVLLCVFNGDTSWDWPLARAAFAEHPDRLVEALLSEVERHGLDGVDIDLEGQDDHDQDQAAFVAFIRRLSARLHANGCHLTVDSFAYKWNAPNHRWWPDLLPHVDGLTTMGYAQIGAGAEGWRGYAYQVATAGEHASKLMIGLPSRTGHWQERSLREHLRWIEQDGRAGVSIWDAQLKSDAWRQAEVWELIRNVRDRSPRAGNGAGQPASRKPQ